MRREPPALVCVYADTLPHTTHTHTHTPYTHTHIHLPPSPPHPRILHHIHTRQYIYQPPLHPTLAFLPPRATTELSAHLAATTEVHEAALDTLTSGGPLTWVIAALLCQLSWSSEGRDCLVSLDAFPLLFGMLRGNPREQGKGALVRRKNEERGREASAVIRILCGCVPLSQQITHLSLSLSLSHTHTSLSLSLSLSSFSLSGVYGIGFDATTNRRPTAHRTAHTFQVRNHIRT